jgi:ubiquinone/menaquinone biosynthesis C-methylase UbiE
MMSKKNVNKLSKRLTDIIEALPLYEGIRILEIGCGPGALAREISTRIGDGHILAIDRSAKAIKQAITGSKKEIDSGRLSFRQAAIENFKPEVNEKHFDLAVAIRVGALDGRHPKIEKKALKNIANSLTKHGKLFTDGGNPVKEIPLDEFKNHTFQQ